MNRQTNTGLDALWNLLELAKAPPSRTRLIPATFFNRNLRTTDAIAIRSEVGMIFVFHSLETALQLEAMVQWHDEPDHCRTWTDGGGCACDVEAVDCKPPPAHYPAPLLVIELKLGPNGLEVLPARPPTPAEAESVNPTPEVIKHERQGPHDPKTCARCLNGVAAQAFGPPSSPGVA